MSSWSRGEFILTTDKTAFQIDRVHLFLSTKAYWCLEIPKSVVQKAADNSLTFTLLKDSRQVGYARVVTDYATTAGLCDVYVEEEFRGQGLSKWMMDCVMETLKPMKLRRIALATKDAHGLYAQYGFEVAKNPQNNMEIKNNQIYQG